MDVGNGRNNLFWENKWCYPIPLRLEFPSIFNISSNRKAFVAEYWGNDGEGSRWNVQLRRHLNDWEVEDMLTLLGCINAIQPSLDKVDSHRWPLKANGSFTVKSCYGSFGPKMRLPSHGGLYGIVESLPRHRFLCGQCLKAAFSL